MTKIIGICGTKQSGKTTTSNFLHGHEMKLHDVIDRFEIKPDGSLEVNTTFIDENGKESHDIGILDLYQNSEQFYEYATRRIWPLIRNYSFADALKEICVMLFDMPPECVYGTDDQKNQVQEHLRWESMPGVIACSELWDHMHPDGESEYGLIYHAAGPMTAREFMQFLGTDIMRRMYGPIWLNNCMKRIRSDNSAIAIVPDCRFINEMEMIKENNGILIRLLRCLFKSDHASEQDVDKWNDYDLVVDNRNLSIQESNKAVLDYLISIGVTRPVRFDNGRYTSVK